MNIRGLHQFLTLAEHLHFGRASIASSISISALSRNIRQLEQETGAELFHRDNRPVSLTPNGLLFQQYAKEATRQWRQVCLDMNKTDDQLQGEISLYCSVTASQSILFDLLNRFRQSHPGIDIKLHTGDPEHSISRIVAGDEEVAIAALPPSMPRGVVFKSIAISPLLFIAPKNQLGMAVPKDNNPEQWSKLPMILAEKGLGRNRVDQWFRAVGVNPRIYAQVAGNEAIVSMVSLGFGIGVVPEIVIENSSLAEQIKVLDIEPELESYNLGLFALKRSLNNPLVRAFWGSTDH